MEGQFGAVDGWRGLVKEFVRALRGNVSLKYCGVNLSAVLFYSFFSDCGGINVDDHCEVFVIEQRL